MLELKARHPKRFSKRHPYYLEAEYGASQSADGSWKRLDRTMDREHDWYDELVTDPISGQTIHECHERLVDHWGHGSAKKKPAADDGDSR